MSKKANNKSADKVKEVWKARNHVEIPNTTRDQFIDIIKPIASLFSAGDFFYFVFDFASLKMTYVSDSVTEVLGIKPQEYTLDYFFNNTDPEYLKEYPKIENTGFHFLMKEINTVDIPKYKVIYLIKIKNKKGQYKILLHQSKAIKISKDGKAQQVFCVQTDVTNLDITMDYNVSFISQDLPSFISLNNEPPYRFEKLHRSFTVKEIELISEISRGKTNREIADTFNISEHTVKTRKKNILKKSGCNSTSHLVAKSIREGFI